MGKQMRPWSRRILDVLSDGLEHEYSHVVEEASKAVPPGVAFRCAEERRQKAWGRTHGRDPGDAPKRVRGDMSSAIMSGQKSLIREALHTLKHRSYISIIEEAANDRKCLKMESKGFQWISEHANTPFAAAIDNNQDAEDLADEIATLVSENPESTSVVVPFIFLVLPSEENQHAWQWVCEPCDLTVSVFDGANSEITAEESLRSHATEVHSRATKHLIDNSKEMV